MHVYIHRCLQNKRPLEQLTLGLSSPFPPKMHGGEDDVMILPSRTGIYFANTCTYDCMLKLITSSGISDTVSAMHRMTHRCPPAGRAGGHGGSCLYLRTWTDLWRFTNSRSWTGLAPTAVPIRTSEPPRRFEPFHRLGSSCNRLTNATASATAVCLKLTLCCFTEVNWAHYHIWLQVLW